MYWRLLLTLILFFQIVKAQTPSFGESLATGNTQLNHKDVYSCTNHAAYLSYIDSSQINLAFNHYPLSNDIFAGNVGIGLNRKVGAFAFTNSFFGNKNYLEGQVSMAFAKQIKLFSLGLNYNYHFLKIANYGVKHWVSIDISYAYRISKQITISGKIENPIPMKIQKENKETRPSGIVIGTSYQPNNKAQIFLEVENNFQTKFDCRVGMKYAIHQTITILFGCDMLQQTISYGLTIPIHQRFQFQAAAQWNNAIGHQYFTSCTFIW